MFDQFLSQGSILSIIFMVYACNVMIEAIRIDRLDPHGLYIAPGVLSHPMSGIFIFAAVPCIIWPGVYIGLYDGWVAGSVAWFILQIVGAVMTIILGIRRCELIGTHFTLACVVFPIGYYLSISSL